MSNSNFNIVKPYAQDDICQVVYGCFCYLCMVATNIFHIDFCSYGAGADAGQPAI